MARLILLFTGLLLLLFSLLSIWITSVPGHLTIARLGLPVPDLQPKDMGMPFLTSFTLSYILLVGNFLEGLTGAIASSLAGGHTMEPQSPGVRGLFIWGIVAYLLMAFGFGLLLIFFILPGEKSPFRLLELPMLSYILTWPYHVLAALGAFGLSSTDFYR